jgi:hypothetical protein
VHPYSLDFCTQPGRWNQVNSLYIVRYLRRPQWRFRVSSSLCNRLHQCTGPAFGDPAAAIPPTAWFWPLACQPASVPAASVQVCKFDQGPLCFCALHSIGNRSDPIFGCPLLPKNGRMWGRYQSNTTAKCGIPSTQTTSKRRPLFAVVQSARGHRARGGSALKDQRH